MISKPEAAAQLNGSQYGEEGSRELFASMKEAGLVAVFGASDDLMEFRGAIHDELGAWDGGSAYLTSAGLLVNDCDDDECPHFTRAKENAVTIDALWASEGDYSWTFKTAIPHETFEIVEGDEPYCRGLVFALADVATLSSTQKEQNNAGR